MADGSVTAYKEKNSLAYNSRQTSTITITITIMWFINKLTTVAKTWQHRVNCKPSMSLYLHSSTNYSFRDYFVLWVWEALYIAFCQFVETTIVSLFYVLWARVCWLCRSPLKIKLMDQSPDQSRTITLLASRRHCSRRRLTYSDTGMTLCLDPGAQHEYCKCIFIHI